jgi:hypothetical protein
MAFERDSWRAEASLGEAMLSFLADENFNNDIIRGVRRRDRNLIILRVQDVGLSGLGDPEVLLWAAENSVAVLTHDVSTMTRYALDRVRLGHRMPGLFEAGRRVPVASVIDDVVLIATCGLEGEWEGRVTYLPLR